MSAMREVACSIDIVFRRFRATGVITIPPTESPVLATERATARFLSNQRATSVVEMIRAVAA